MMSKPVKVRLSTNATGSGVNAASYVPSFRYPSLHDALSIIQPGDFIAIGDIKRYYIAFPFATEAYYNFGVEIANKVYYYLIARFWTKICEMVYEKTEKPFSPYLPISLSPYLPISLSHYLPFSLSPFSPFSLSSVLCPLSSVLCPLVSSQRSTAVMFRIFMFRSKRTIAGRKLVQRAMKLAISPCLKKVALLQERVVFCPLSSVLCPLSSVFCLLSSVFCLLSSVLREARRSDGHHWPKRSLGRQSLGDGQHPLDHPPSTPHAYSTTHLHTSTSPA
jgi:hypothetical protein